jgi:tripeptide aminopeptidase
MVNAERLAETFKTLAAIGSESRREGRLAAEMGRTLEALGAEVGFDEAGERIGGECGNLIARLPGTVESPALLLNAHMDTVGPGEGVRVRFEDGVFESDGSTILGADDKSALAVILEALRSLGEARVPRSPLEIVLTVGEEIGLAGARHLDFGRLTAAFGYTLDGSDTEGIIVQAPAADRFEIRVHGRDAHAGAHPERGINAIHLAAKAMAGLAIGRIDRETTCNIGRIEGGSATNIVPPLVVLTGEARSHDEEKLARLTAEIIAAFERTAAEHRPVGAADGLPRIEAVVTRSYRPTRIPDDHALVALARRAAEGLGRPMRTKISGGGSDANIFFAHGIPLGILGTGMREIHTLREHVRLEEMVRAAELLVEIIRLFAAEARPGSPPR